MADEKLGLHIRMNAELGAPLELAFVTETKHLKAELPEKAVVELLRRRGYIVHPPAIGLAGDKHQVPS